MLEDEKTRNTKFKTYKKHIEYWKQFRHWRKGYEAGKAGESSTQNPYTLTPDMLSLLRKRTRWQMGWEEAAFNHDFTAKRIAKRVKDDRKEKRKEEERTKHWEEKQLKKNSSHKKKKKKRHGRH